MKEETGISQKAQRTILSEKYKKHYFRSEQNDTQALPQREHAGFRTKPLFLSLQHRATECALSLQNWLSILTCKTHCQYFSIQKIEIPHIKTFVNVGDRNKIKWDNASSKIVDQGANNKNVWYKLDLIIR